MSSVVDAECETATVHALRRDLAWQISKAMKTRGSSQRSLAAELRLPQPTVSKILNGRIESLSLELLLRLAVRLELSLVIQTGRDATEAAVYRQVAPKPFVDGGRDPSRAHSAVSAHAATEQLAAARRQSPALRLSAFLAHNRLIARLRLAGQRVSENRDDQR